MPAALSCPLHELEAALDYHATKTVLVSKGNCLLVVNRLCLCLLNQTLLVNIFLRWLCTFLLHETFALRRPSTCALLSLRGLCSRARP